MVKKMTSCVGRFPGKYTEATQTDAPEQAGMCQNQSQRAKTLVLGRGLTNYDDTEMKKVNKMVYKPATLTSGLRRSWKA